MSQEKKTIEYTDICYFWFDHLVLRDNGDADIVQKAIDEHDFDTFMKYYKKYPPIDTEFGPIPYFPDDASVYDGDEIVGSVYILNKNMFDKITFSEYECG